MNVPIRNILVVLQRNMDIEPVLDGALAVARRMESHLEVLLLQPDPVEMTANYVMVSAPCNVPLEALEAENHRTAEELQGRFEAWRRANHLPDTIVQRKLRTTYARWTSWSGSPEIGLLRRGRLADLIVMAAPRPRLGLSATLIDIALFDSGRPVLLLPGPVLSPPLLRVAVAWNGSLQSVRALSAAIPFLHESGEVHIFAVVSARRSTDVDPAFIPAEDVLEALSWQGIRAVAVHVRPLEHESVGAALLREAASCDISLMVLGAFTHSRIRESLLGGVTRTILDQASIPVLMTH